MRTYVRARTEIREEALRLVAAGVNDCEVARLGIAARPCATGASSLLGQLITCPRCGGRLHPLAFSDPDYAELLGLYLGDGNISRLARTQSLRISLDARYRGIVDDSESCSPRFRHRADAWNPEPANR